MKIFLSSRYSRRDELRLLRLDLQRLGYTVVSRWLDTEWNETERESRLYSSAAPPEYRQQYAVTDLADVVACDCLIAFTEPPRSKGRGGRHVEYGAALALAKRILVVGYHENLFHHHPSVEFFHSWSDAVAFLPDIAPLLGVKP